MKQISRSEPSADTSTGSAEAGDADPISARNCSARRPSLFQRINGTTIVATALIYVVAVQTLSPPIAMSFLLLSACASSLALLSMIADVQTLRRRRRTHPDMAALPIYAILVGTFFSAALLAVWAVAAIGVATID